MYARAAGDGPIDRLKQLMGGGQFDFGGQGLSRFPGFGGGGGFSGGGAGGGGGSGFNGQYDTTLSPGRPYRARMNYQNPHALRRAIRRLEGAEKQYAKLLKIVKPGACHHGHPAPKTHRRKR